MKTKNNVSGHILRGGAAAVLFLFAMLTVLLSLRAADVHLANHFGPSQPSGTATFNGIGFAPGYNSSEVRATNANGSVAIGGSGLTATPGTDNGRVAVQWTAAGGLVTLPQIPYDGTPVGGPPDGTNGNFIVGSDITASGGWIAYRARPGYPNQLGRREAVICSADFSQVIPLGRLAANRRSVANQISDDGSIVFGFAEDANINQQVFRWTQGTGMQALPIPAGYPTLPNYDNANVTSGRACSADGSISVGSLSAYDVNTGDEFDVQAYRWTQATGIQLLGYLPGGDRSAAIAISGDGSTIFGVSRSTNAPGTGQTNPWDYSGELFVWTASSGMTPLGVPSGYDLFGNFGGVTADGALFTTSVGDSTHVKPDGFVVIRTATTESFESNDLLVSAGLGSSITGWSGLGTFGISDNGDTLFGSGIDPNGLNQGWVANFPVGYLRTVQTFNSSNPNNNVNITGGSIGQDGNYSANNVVIGGPFDGGSLKTPSGAGASLTLSGTATLLLGGTLTVNSSASLNLLGSATVTAHALNLAAGATLGVELDAAAESISRISISDGPINLTGQPTLNLIVSYGPTAGTAYTIIHNTSGQNISGQFSGLPQNGTVLAGNRGFRATYSGGSTGRDFVLTVLPPPPVSSVVSRMTHGGSGTFDVDLTTGNGVECRSSSSLGAGNYSVVFTFANSLVSVGRASVSSGTGSVSSTTMSANQYTVNLTGVTNAQVTTVTLTSAVDSQNNAGDISVPMGVLIADTNANRSVNAGDVSQTKARIGQTLNATNFRSDVNASGGINAGDVSVVKSNLGTGLPAEAAADRAHLGTASARNVKP